MVQDRLVTLIQEEIHSVPVQVTTTLEFLRKIKVAHLNRKVVKRDIHGALREELNYGSTIFSPDKSDNILDRLDLFLYEYAGDGFDATFHVEIQTKQHKEFPVGKQGWTNVLYLDGRGGLYSVQIQNGFYYLR